MTRVMRIVTIGVYGFSEEAFFRTLQEAGVDTFCDIRWRRGVRGREYAFANSARLQKRLAELGIRYLHFRELAPSPELRKRQTAADKAAGVEKRKRTGLVKPLSRVTARPRRALTAGISSNYLVVERK
jgi:uncharacterized protein (DUF488 family)